MNKHVWKLKWKVSPADLTEVEAWVEEAIRRSALAGMHKGVFGDAKLTANSGWDVDVLDCKTLDGFGRLTEVGSETIDLSTDEDSQSTQPPVNQSRWILVAIEYLIDSTNPQTDPILGTPFDFHNLDDYKVRIIAGAATGGTPTPPAIGDAIIIGGIIRDDVMSGASQGDLDAGEDELLHNLQIMFRGQLSEVDTNYLINRWSALSGINTMQDLLEWIAENLTIRTGDTFTGNLRLASGARVSADDTGGTSHDMLTVLNDPVLGESNRLGSPGRPTLIEGSFNDGAYIRVAGGVSRPIAYVRKTEWDLSLQDGNDHWHRIAKFDSLNGRGMGLLSVQLKDAGVESSIFGVSKSASEHGSITLIHNTPSGVDRVKALRIVRDTTVDSNSTFVDIKVLHHNSITLPMAAGSTRDWIDEDLEFFDSPELDPTLTPAVALILELDVSGNPMSAGITGSLVLFSGPQPNRGYAIFSDKSEFAYDNTTSGLTATELSAAVDEVDGNLDTHVADTSDPHSVTPAQIGAYTTAQVDALVDASLVPPEAYNPTITGNYPLTFGGGAIKGGHSYRITAAGTMGGITVNIEDLLIALVDTPGQTDGNWMVAESNRDQATETVKGVAEIITAAEVITGTDDERILTVLKAVARFLSKSGGTMTGVLNLVSGSKILKAADPDEGGELVFEAAGSNIDVHIDQNGNKFRIVAGGGKAFSFDTDTGNCEIPALGDFKLAAGASLKAHGHTGASDGGQVVATGIADGAVIDTKLGIGGGDNYHFETEKTGLLYTLGAADFTRQFENVDISFLLDGHYLKSNTADSVDRLVFAILHLPDGAVVTEARIGYSRINTSAVLTVTIIPITKLDETIGSAFVSITDKATGIGWDINTQTGISETITNSTKYYVVKALLNNNGVAQNMKFAFLEITYKITNLLPVG